MAKIYYNMSCPTLVKDYDYSDAERYAQEVLEAKSELIEYLYRAYQKNSKNVLERLGIQPQGRLSKDEFSGKLRLQTAIDLFPSARFCVQYLAPFHRFICIFLYLLGFGFLFWIFILQTYRVLAFFLVD